MQFNSATADAKPNKDSSTGVYTHTHTHHICRPIHIHNCIPFFNHFKTTNILTHLTLTF